MKHTYKKCCTDVIMLAPISQVLTKSKPETVETEEIIHNPTGEPPR